MAQQMHANALHIEILELRFLKQSLKILFCLTFMLIVDYFNRYADKQKRWKLLKEERNKLVERFVLILMDILCSF